MPRTSKPFDDLLQVNRWDPRQVCDGDGQVRGCAPVAHFVGHDATGNARRAVAAWNACHGVPLAVLEGQGGRTMVWNEVDRRAKDAEARDHALLAWGLAAGLVRWKAWSEAGAGELCIAGLCHATRLDDQGVPRLTQAVREALLSARARH